MKPPRIILAAGGTGGHLLPALSLALAVRRRAPEAEFLFIGAGRPLEETILAPAGLRRAVLKTSGLKGFGLGAKIKALGQCCSAVFEASGLIRDFKPQICFGAGGYVTVPVGLAARMNGLPLLIHEQNSRPGLSNRFLGRLARKVMLGFPEGAAAFPAAKCLVTGNPVRPEIAGLHDLERDFQSLPLTVLVTGGSQGARGLNRAAAPALARLVRSGLKLDIVHQAGAADLEQVRKAYQEAGVRALAAEFFQDMAALYRRAHLVIARAGAVTVSELAAAGLPSLLVPLPTAADDHQTVNAGHLASAGAALLMPEKDLTAETLAGTLRALLSDPAALEKMSRAAAASARLGADEEMAAVCLELIAESARPV
ncbi:MAG: undecaprenyldiphospho-muramoylpentapeptide beta-N-acetylglucosaminyltransferase [Candidatus Adiutrix sp.]|jgi:UDP-N-acetylglucosamine--N-acetylmuramyl-(pentapeptide) pyrophosphoryl-undecaprenol N-acetylglucosamine transferase|nr:undecaprenyldiphospho-muramoylpentapeptide beta-N-acetylglucosaminyltransferase [Candidatus Adiutrix sp.]